MRRDILGAPITSPVRPIGRLSKPSIKSEKSIVEVAVEDTLSPVVVNEEPVIVQETIRSEVKNTQVKTILSNKKIVSAHMENIIYSENPRTIIEESMTPVLTVIPITSIINTLPPTNTGQQSMVTDSFTGGGAVVRNDTINDTIGTVVTGPNTDITATKFDFLGDKIIGFASMNPDEGIFIPLKKPGKPRVLTRRPANIYMTNYSSLQIIVDELMELYKEEIEDENSRYYKLFNTLAKVNSTDAFQIFFMFFTNIDREIFTIEDYFMFLDNNELDVNYESIVKYLSEVKSNKVEIMNKRLKEGIYEVYGNLYDYID
jgi:hypothetical protein